MTLSHLPEPVRIVARSVQLVPEHVTTIMQDTASNAVALAGLAWLALVCVLAVVIWWRSKPEREET